MFAEVALSGGFHAIGAGAEIDAVEIEIENLVLGELVLQPQRQHDLLKLAAIGALLRQEQVLGELLRQRGAALRNAAAHDVGNGGTRDADRIDTEMRMEAPVLDGDEGLRHVFRQVFHPGRNTAVATHRQNTTIRSGDLDRRRTFRHFERLDRRQVSADPDDDPDETDHPPQTENEAPIGDADGQGFATPAAAGPALLRRGRRIAAGGFGLAAAGRLLARARLGAGHVLVACRESVLRVDAQLPFGALDIELWLAARAFVSPSQSHPPQRRISGRPPACRRQR